MSRTEAIDLAIKQWMADQFWETIKPKYVPAGRLSPKYFEAKALLKELELQEANE